MGKGEENVLFGEIFEKCERLELRYQDIMGGGGGYYRKYLENVNVSVMLPCQPMLVQWGKASWSNRDLHITRYNGRHFQLYSCKMNIKNVK